MQSGLHGEDLYGLSGFKPRPLLFDSWSGNLDNFVADLI